MHDLANQKKNPTPLEKLLPAEGAPVPQLNDLVRARVQCQFLDGVEYLVDRLEELANKLSLKPSRRREGRIEGYFAQHFYFYADVFFRFGGGPKPTSIKCEVQVATELSTRVWDVAHPVYEQWRGQVEHPEDWQWKPDDPRFLARQFGHMIHLADGMLVQLRELIRSKG
jgi:hypothetical protein